ncbi:MAG: hypothetical protein US48_C0044G0005 [Candidatus Levybacteria bacterium GW2011_GWA2_37_36]|nr:MAG: hypothetical protein US43_C0015G0017 [Candidatus Levybacteria bacterium GW2011_GWA1_37_16]KKQ31892.1 MAG: hypothetical protein US48_C0044G0005 [Candidatus Levybacteria bacterium GW2011_GWA2_37_36]KKQ38625.1 MAG: hypothetical protein US55_C0003G0005 [Candidatus Levybacteria bacterium GW2011_GWC2_37_7]KKQ42422.1 MAG: hypothetical protein US59_C0009G0018 [Candidatus Levybacteria bacterium GW2011_GWB1_37_8]OGH50064.1 MAG: hypothetical protein A3H17_02455 [Candidatus Levybacteria bacterium R
MKEFLSHLFTPRESNNHRAKILHHTNLFLTIIFLLLASFLIQGIKGAFPSVLGIKADVSSEELLSLTNKERRNAGVNPLIFNEKLSEAAIKKAQDMFEYDYWAHNSPSGKTPWVFIKSSGYKYVYAGENLARGFSTAEDVIKAWMTSSAGHRENMLSSNYQDVGFAVKIGKLNGEETVLVVEELGNLYMPIAKSRVQEIATATDANTLQKNVQAVRNQPLISTSALSSNIYYVFIIVFITALFLDMIIIEKNKIMRFVGHNIDHILYLLLILILAGVWSKGVII